MLEGTYLQRVEGGEEENLCNSISVENIFKHFFICSPYPIHIEILVRYSTRSIYIWPNKCLWRKYLEITHLILCIIGNSKISYCLFYNSYIYLCL